MRAVAYGKWRVAFMAATAAPSAIALIGMSQTRPQPCFSITSSSLSRRNQVLPQDRRPRSQPLDRRLCRARSSGSASRDCVTTQTSSGGRASREYLKIRLQKRHMACSTSSMQASRQIHTHLFAERTSGRTALRVIDQSPPVNLGMTVYPGATNGAFKNCSERNKGSF